MNAKQQPQPPTRQGFTLSTFTQKVLLSSDDEYSLSYDGTFNMHPSHQLSSYVTSAQPQGLLSGISSIFSLSQEGHYSPEYPGTPLSCYEGFTQFARGYGKTLLCGKDLMIYGDQVIDRTITLSIFGVYFAAFIFIVVKHYTQKEISFWK